MCNNTPDNTNKRVNHVTSSSCSAPAHNAPGSARARLHRPRFLLLMASTVSGL